MKAEMVEINNEVLARLKNCPQCDGTLKQRRSYSIRCENCGLDIDFERATSRYFAWGFMASTLAFVLGGLVVIFIF